MTLFHLSHLKILIWKLCIQQNWSDLPLLMNVDQNTSNIVQKGNSRLWFLRRLKSLGESKETLKDIYKLFCRSKLDLGAPVWAGSLTARNKAYTESVQQNALRIIIGSPSAHYEELLKTLELDNLTQGENKSV